MKISILLFLLPISFNAHAAVKCSDYLHSFSRGPIFSETLPTSIFNGSVEAVRRFIEAEDVNRVYDMSFSELSALTGHSLKYTHKEMLAFLLAENIEQGRLEVVRALLKSKHIEINDNKMSTYTPLFQAISKGNVEMLKLLLEDVRLDVNHSPIPQMTTLAYAVGRGSVEVVKLLLTRESIEINQKVRVEIFPGEWKIFTTHPLVIAIQRNNMELFKLLYNDVRTDPSGLSASKTTPLIASTKAADSYYKRKLLNHPEIDIRVRDARGLNIDDYTRTKGGELELYFPIAPVD